MRLIHHPLRVKDIPAPIQTVLRDLAGQDGCDGEPYDQMMEAADYIDELEREVEAVRKHFGWKRDGRSIAEILESDDEIASKYHGLLWAQQREEDE